MKSIRDFVASKIRRAELADRVRLEPLTEPHPILGKPEGTLSTAAERAALYEGGVLISGEAIPYTVIRGLVRGQRPDGTRVLTIERAEAPPFTLEVSAAGGVVLHATLRWVGRARFRTRWDRD